MPSRVDGVTGVKLVTARRSPNCAWRSKRPRTESGSPGAIEPSGPTSVMLCGAPSAEARSTAKR
jgi:hypothetical protein